MIEEKDMKKFGTVVKVLHFDPSLSERETFFKDEETEMERKVRHLNSVSLIGYCGRVVSWDLVRPNSFEESYVIQVEFSDGSTYEYLPEELELACSISDADTIPDLYSISDGTYRELSSDEMINAKSFIESILSSGDNSEAKDLVERAVNISLEFSGVSKLAWLREYEREIVKGNN